MRKKYFRWLLANLKKNPAIIRFKYRGILRIFKTEKATFVLINSRYERGVYVYYYYMPEGIFVGRTFIYKRTYKLTEKIILEELNKIETDEYYRQFRIQEQRNLVYRTEGTGYVL